MTYLLHQLLCEAAATGPDREALRCRGQSATYAEVQGASNGLANALIAHGLHRGDRVGIYLPKRLEMVTAVFAILKAGAAYVPLDPVAPVERVARMAGDCGIRALVATGGRAAALLQAMGGVRPEIVVFVKEESEQDRLPGPVIMYDTATADRHAGDPAVPTIDLDLACILYTSGSTGHPKGVMHTHRSVLTAVAWWGDFMRVTPADRILNFTPLHFAPTLADIFGGARAGAAVVLVPEEQTIFGAALLRILHDERITLWITVPAALILLTKLLDKPTSFPRLRAIAFTGEVYPAVQVRELRRLLPGVALGNFYGSTETLFRSIFLLPDHIADDEPLPIAGACSNLEFLLLCSDGTEAAVGQEGELYVRGSSLMCGYWGQAEKTDAVLVPHPLASPLRELVFRTGDFLRRRPDGHYDFLGRKDQQVKVRGYRVELGEIEAALGAHPDIQEAIALAVPHASRGLAIVAYVVLRESRSLDARAVQGHVAARLPQYMVPSRVEIRAELPHTSSGKIDRQQILVEVCGQSEAGL